LGFLSSGFKDHINGAPQDIISLLLMVANNLYTSPDSMIESTSAFAAFIFS
jgi:hypothetical protein